MTRNLVPGPIPAIRNRNPECLIQRTDVNIFFVRGKLQAQDIFCQDIPAGDDLGHT